MRTCGLGIFFEHIALNTPQQNGRVECKFVTLFERVCSMFNERNVDLAWREVLWAEVANMQQMEK